MFSKSVFHKLLIIYTLVTFVIILFLIFPYLTFTPVNLLLKGEPTIIVHTILLTIFWISFLRLLIKKELNKKLAIYSLIVLIVTSTAIGSFGSFYFYERVNDIRSVLIGSRAKIEIVNFENEALSTNEQKVTYTINANNLPNTNRYYVFEIKLLRNYEPPADPAENYVANTTIRIWKQGGIWRIEETTRGQSIYDKINYTSEQLPNEFKVSYTYKPQELNNVSLDPNMLEITLTESESGVPTSFDRPIYYESIEL